MFIITTNKINKANGFVQTTKGLELRGGLTPIKIIATLTKLKILSYFDKGYKPFRYQGDKTKIKEKGWFIRLGNGGKSGEPLIRFNFGSKFSSFHAYNRNGKPRVTQNWYVAFKSRLAQKLVA
tara:strand:- start:160 stop:528 length:369 start_codon:yes stop_codon:yes gene_type:complete